MLGTFYRAEAPGKPPFVDVGQRVEPDTIVCIIEVMKMMNSVTAGVSGTIAEVVPDNAALVEYGAAAVPGGTDASGSGSSACSSRTAARSRYGS